MAQVGNSKVKTRFRGEGGRGKVGKRREGREKKKEKFVIREGK